MKPKTYIATSNLANGGTLIKIGEVFVEHEIEAHLLERYLELGAVEPYNGDGLAAEDAPKAPPVDVDPLSAMTVKELVAYAGTKDLEIPTGAKKADILAILVANREAEALAEAEEDPNEDDDANDGLEGQGLA